MKYIITILIIFASFTCSAQKRNTIAGFQNSDRYDQQDVLRVNPDLDSIPVVDSFKYNRSLGFFQQDDAADAIFLRTLRSKYFKSFFGNTTCESNIGKNNFYISPLVSGASVIFSADTVGDYRIFIVMSSYYYFVIHNGIVRLYYKMDEHGKIVGMSKRDGRLLEDRPVRIMKKLLTSKVSLLKKKL